MTFSTEEVKQAYVEKNIIFKKSSSVTKFPSFVVVEMKSVEF